MDGCSTISYIEGWIGQNPGGVRYRAHYGAKNHLVKISSQKSPSPVNIRVLKKSPSPVNILVVNVSQGTGHHQVWYHIKLPVDKIVSAVHLCTNTDFDSSFQLSSVQSIFIDSIQNYNFKTFMFTFLQHPDSSQQKGKIQLVC